ncbi:MAG: ATP-binding protein, partial [Acidobacteria bacterium]
MKAYEKLGAFYLGRTWDPERSEPRAETLLYDSRDLTTHAVCLGMTGSGKTGLCVALVEEAAIDGIPVIAIDPKGDLGNLLLTFPKLRPADFAPWIDEGEARRHGVDPATWARRTAARWKRGLAEWDQDGTRIARLREAADFAIYTPGGGGGRPLSVLRSLAPPSREVLADPDARRDRVSGAVTALLTLLGVDADPLRSREHVLCASILEHVWGEGRALDLPQLIRLVQKPPFERIGVLDLDAFFPPDDRFELAMAINALVASPGFSGWLEGEPLDIDRLLYTAEGRPRVSILSIAHLDDRERAFFVTALLHELIGWMHDQPGTSSLRALLYIDEVFGMLPPTAMPPTKTPLLRLLKQARAFGLGLVLATQNPVDLDYKALSNIGTWFLGRLQTERDKARVLDGLEGTDVVARGFDRAQTARLLSGMPSRVFLMHDVHEDAPALFHVRWVMSYLRGPLTTPQIRRLAGTGSPAPSAAAEPPGTAAAARPVLPPGVDEEFLAPRRPLPGGARLVYRPRLLGAVRLHWL